MLFKDVENFDDKNTFYSSYKNLCVVENSFPIIEKLNIINTRKRAKTNSTYVFSTLHTTIPHNLLIKVLSEIIHLVFKSKLCTKIGFSATSIYWTSKGLSKRYFTEKSVIEAIRFLIKNCCFTIGNMVFKQDIGIPMGIEPAPSWAIFWSQSMFKILFLKSQIELINTLLLVDS